MKKRIIAALILALVLLLAVPAALAADVEGSDGIAVFSLDGQLYLVESDESGVQVVRTWDYTTGDFSETPGSLPEGVSYNLATNKLTLEDAQLETAEFRFRVLGEVGEIVDYWLPNANLTIELVGENSVALNPTAIEPNQSYHALVFGGGIHATVTGSGSLAVSTVASHDGFAILACEDSTLTFADQAKVTAEVNGTYESADEEGPVEVPALVSSGAAVTVQDQASFTAKDPVSFGGEGARRAAFTVEDQATATIDASDTGLRLYQTDLTVSGGALSIQMTGNGATGVNPDGVEYDNWAQGAYCDSSSITISGGTLDIDFPNGTGIGFGGEGSSTLAQTGGRLDVTATDTVDSVCLELYQISYGETQITFRGGVTKFTGLQGLYVGSGNVITLENGANVTIDSDSESYYGGCNVDGTLNVHGGTFIVDANNTYALQLNEDSAYNQSGGDVTLTASGSDSCGFLASGNDCRITISGGTLTATSGYTGAAFLSDFTLLGGTVVINGVSAGATVNGCAMQLRGGSLQINATGENSQAVILVPNEGTSLTVTGGNHSFLAPVTGEESQFPQGLRSISVPVSFQGGSVRMTGNIPMIWFGELWEYGTTEDGANQITLSDGMHIVSNTTGNELTMVQFTEEGTTTVPGEEGEFDYTIYEYYCTEDNTIGGTVCTDLTVSAVAGETPVGYTGSMEVISGQATVGAPVVIQYTVAAQGTVDITLPNGLDYIEGSLSVNGQAANSLTGIQVDGSAVILLSVKPMVTQSLTVTAGVTTAEGSYQETCTVKASGFDITAPTYTKVPEIRVSGRGTPDDVVTLEITGENNNSKTVEIEVTELGTFAAAVELPVQDVKVAEKFTLEVSVDGRKVKEMEIQYDPNTSTVTYLSITNVVHNNKNERVTLTVDVDYLADAAQQSYYTYWPDEDLFTFEVTFDGTVTDAKVLVTLQDGTVKEVELDPTTDPKVWTGELKLTDPSNPPVRYQVGWNTGAYEALSSAHTFMPIMDPSGVVYSGRLDTPVAGATVTLLYGGNGTDPSEASVFDMEPFDQVNPQITDALGNYGWNVPEGWWKIRATYVQNGKTYTVESQWLHVQPVQTGVNLDLDLPTAPSYPGGILLPGLVVGGDDGFRDVAEGAYYYDAVEWAVDKGVTEGTGSGKFSPDRACTRAEIVTFLWRAAGCPVPVSEENPFTDVHQGDYYYDAVLWAVEQGITQGTSRTTFSPGATCTRAQAVTFLYRYFASPATSAALSFTDVPASAYYYNAVRWAVAGGITQGTGKNTFRPDKTCTRAEIVTFLYRAMA